MTTITSATVPGQPRGQRRRHCPQQIDGKDRAKCQGAKRVADHPQEFADAVVRASGDPDLWQRLSDSGEAYADREN